MATSDLPPCGCDLCQQGVDHPAREMHRQTIALLAAWIKTSGGGLWRTKPSAWGTAVIG